jgi:hypothetical protein
VARYLRALALEMSARQERALVQRLSEMVWLTLFDRGEIRMAAKQQAIHFLKEHAKTYLNSFDINRIVQLVTELGEPSRHAETLRPPRLMGRQRSVHGQGKAQLQDDLSERIYVAYYALRRAGTKNARTRIAAALNRFHLKTRARPGTERTWGSAEVMERVRQFEDRLMRQHRLLGRPHPAQQIERLRNMLVDSWIHGFHFALEVESASRSRST